jgi:uncharacterized protein DUF4238
MPRKKSARKRSKHQHWVPQFYLRPFATPESRSSDHPQVWIFSKNHADGPEALTNVRNVCGKRYLYSPVLPSGERSWELDELLDNLESLLGRIWPTVATDFVDFANPSLRKSLALFIAVMYLRHPETRLLVEKIHADLCDLLASAPAHPDGTPAVEAITINGRTHQLAVRDWHEYRNWNKHDHDRFFVATVRSEASRLALALMEKRWSVIIADTDAFITSDRPVAMHHRSREKYGFDTPGTLVTFPLGPTRVLVLDDEHEEPGNQYYSLAKGDPAALNMSIWRGASRFLITGRSVDAVLEELRTFADATNDA